MELPTIPEEEKLVTRVPWVEFLQSTPPGVMVITNDFVPKSLLYIHGYGGMANNAELRLHCENESCGGERTFECVDPLGQIQLEERNYLLNYRCRNCKKFCKYFAVRTLFWEKDEAAVVMKIGEYPSFGPPAPRKLLTLLGSDSEIYLKGRRAENQGLGIGAFAYYRRVVENQKGRLIREIIKVAERENYPLVMIAELKAASDERQFNKAIAKIKAGIPKSLYVKNHNPLVLLHDALSEGLHAETDEVCLKMAEAIRLILVQLANRLSELLRDDAQLNDALTTLLKKDKTPE